MLKGESIRGSIPGLHRGVPAPGFGPSPATGKRLRAVLCQAEPGSGLGPEQIDDLARRRPDIVVLPEYFWVRPEDRDPHQAAAHFGADLERLAGLSLEIPAIWVGGTLVEPGPSGVLHNTCVVFDAGFEVGRYRKRRLMPGEAAAGLSAGADPGVIPVRGLRLGLLVCADVLDPGSYDDLAPLRPHVIAVPTHSPLRPDDPPEEKRRRDRDFFVAGARRTGAWVLKACTVGRVFGRPGQGRSLVAGPEGIVTGVPFDRESEPQVLETLLDLPFAGS